jgi:hypothetical protein
MAGLACGAPFAAAGDAPLLTGKILGEVISSGGITQMGAAVLLFNRYDVLVRQAVTDPEGRFGFDGLPADLYSIRVSRASFMPAFRRNISVLAGSQNLLRINLANVLSTVDLAPLGATAGTLMSDDWKWVLRASQATRPGLRLLPDSSSSRTRAMSSVFSDTSGLLKFSAGESDVAGGGSGQDMGTAFALATSINGASKVRFSGNLAYIPSAGLPSAGLRATYSRTSSDGGSSPEVSLTVRQVYIPSLLGAGPVSAEPGDPGPALRTASLVVRDKLEVTDQLRVDYGFALQSVSFLSRYNYASPFARATYDLGKAGSFRLAYSSGIQPSDFALSGAASGPGADAFNSADTGDNPAVRPDLNQELTALGQLPRISRRDGSTRVQRTRSYEAGYQVMEGSRTYAVAAYRESLTDASFLLSPSGFVSRGDVMPDLSSLSMVFDVGNVERNGYMASVTQRAGQHTEFAVTGGRGGALIASGDSAASGRGDDLRAMIHKAERGWVTVTMSTTVSRTGTRISTGYGWTDFRALTPLHESLTVAGTQETGWNILVRQPLPGFFGFRMEATADLRNLLAQGYLPITMGSNHAILTNSPRGVRSGLSFIF